MNIRYIGLIAACLLSWCNGAASANSRGAREHITDFHSVLTVHENGKIDVVETITVFSIGLDIKRGIVREFPTRYWDLFGTYYNVSFLVNEVLHNGTKAVYHTESFANGVRLFVGQPDVLIPHGKHTYTLAYTTDRQLGFFDDHDELFWNVTGNGWRLEIARASFEIRLPATIPADTVRFTAYTGYEGDHGQNFHLERSANDTIYGYTTKPLCIAQGLSVAVSWPKGCVQQPTFTQQLLHSIYDNIPFVVLLLWIALLILMHTVVWVRNTGAGTIIPLFYPPDGISPAEAACLDQMKYTPRAVAASIVNLAVHGLITIEYKKKSHVLGSSYGYYILHKKQTEGLNALSAAERMLFSKFFPVGVYTTKSSFEESVIQDSTECALQDDNFNAGAAIDAFQRTVETSSAYYLDRNHEFVGILGTISLAIGGGLLLLASLAADFAWIFESWLTIVLVATTIGVHFWGAWLVKTYTVMGRVKKDALDGFKLFLMTTEKERMSAVGTPPTYTPQLYEKYLPYAIALGVEEEWTKQFDAVFTQMKATANHEYRPLWFHGPFIPSPYYSTHFARTLSTSLVPSSIASGARPGSQSGFAGRSGSGGGAGRGGGGGGGGGW